MSPATAPSDLRTRVLDAADRLLARHGYRGMTVDSIAAEAGIGKGTVYLAFASKEEVALSCIDRMADGLLGELQTIASGPEDHLERLREMLLRRVLGRVDYARAHADSIDALLAAVRPALLLRRERHFAAETEVFAGLLADAHHSGAARSLEPRIAAAALVTATNALLPYSLSIAELGRRPEIERRAVALADLLVQGVAPPPRSHPSSLSHRTRSRRMS